ncbi:hypothetical protein [Treponema phagedenis]|uniref:hypothetical protein n=1 Tax=Treponema phagedenis TaxID=162 RepID=UPI0011E7A88E|nr:hypothetical protein [Treponema phagedenis]QEK04173.1 hypothetical protein FUT83_10375 [Treponema phagedenis]QSH95060.1 hypothetical protein C5O78_08420 [Treponema phagedenis]
MKTDARVEIVHYKNNELTVRIIGDIDKRQMDLYIQHRRDLFRKEAQSLRAGKKPYTVPPIELELSDKRKKRTTGKNSQNTKLHGIIRIIANSTGNAFDVVKYEIKRKAMNELNYPVMKNGWGEVVWNTIYHEPFPQSEADCSTVEASLLIEAAYLLAADLGIFIGDI